MKLPTWSSAMGGSLSGEHGDGQSRAELLPIMFGPQVMQAFREFKNIWDPDNRMNPGKLIIPRQRWRCPRPPQKQISCR